MVSSEVTLIVTIFSLLIFLVLGLPISFGLAFSGMIGIFLFLGLPGLHAIGSVPFQHIHGFSLLAIPLFILMGNILLEYGMGSILYDSIYKLTGRIKGGLAMASTIMCALFGFVCGASSAACATIGSNVLPEMEKRGYDRRLGLGTLASAGSLAILIPPSVIMIVYCVISETSMGAVFVAGIIPGILLALLMMAYIFIRAVINPKVAPIASDKFTLREKIKALPSLLPILCLFLLIIGGIYKGIWSPIEAGASSVFISLLICFIFFRRFYGRAIKSAVLNAVKISAMIYMLIIGGNMLAYVFYITGFQALLYDFVYNLALPGWIVIIIIGFIMMILGTFLDVIALLTVCVPIFLPIIEIYEYSPVWFGIVTIIFCEMAQITPPVGVNLFVILGISPKGTNIIDVAMGAAPYVVIIWILLILMIIFPELVLFIPNMMIK